MSGPLAGLKVVEPQPRGAGAGPGRLIVSPPADLTPMSGPTTATVPWVGSSQSTASPSARTWGSPSASPGRSTGSTRKLWPARSSSHHARSRVANRAVHRSLRSAMAPLTRSAL
jgi:hypothetical protein